MKSQLKHIEMVQLQMQCCPQPLNMYLKGVFSLSPFASFLLLCLAELPPPYTAIASPDAGGVPVINCRVCQSLINLDGKMHQHVVKCTVCNEATVSPLAHRPGGLASSPWPHPPDPHPPDPPLWPGQGTVLLAETVERRGLEAASEVG